MKTTNTPARPAWMLAALACMLLLAGVAAGCSKAAAPKNDSKAILESVAKWYVAQGALDVAGFKAGVYDPTDTLGIATMTAAPAGSTSSTVNWAWSGDKVIVTIPSAESTITLSISAAQPTWVELNDSSGQAGTFVMKNVDGVWKINVVETQKLASMNSSQSVAPSGAVTTQAP